MTMSPTLFIAGVFVMLILVTIVFALALTFLPRTRTTGQPGDPEAAVPAEWPSTRGRLMARIMRAPVDPRRRNRLTFNEAGVLVPRSENTARFLQVEAIYLVDGRSYTMPLLSQWDMARLQAQYPLEELDRRLSSDADIRVFYKPGDPQNARVDYASLPLDIQQLLAPESP